MAFHPTANKSETPTLKPCTTWPCFHCGFPSFLKRFCMFSHTGLLPVASTHQAYSFLGYVFSHPWSGPCKDPLMVLWRHRGLCLDIPVCPPCSTRNNSHFRSLIVSLTFFPSLQSTYYYLKLYNIRVYILSYLLIYFLSSSLECCLFEGMDNFYFV